LTVASVTQGSNGGTVTLVAGVVTYAPAANFAGTETFTYTIIDGNGGTATVVTVLATDSFAPATGETLTVTSVTPGSNGGTVTLVAGVVTYAPAANFSGTETFTYTIGD